MYLQAINPPSMLTPIDAINQYVKSTMEFTLEPLPTEECIPAEKCVPVPKKREKKMYDLYHENTTETERQRNYLSDRAWEAKDAHDNVIYNTYGLKYDYSPTDPKEFVQRIKDGDFELKKPDRVSDDGTEKYHDSNHRYILWKSSKTDREGYKTAHEKLTKAYQFLKDSLTVVSPAEGLAALREFEKATFH